MEISEEIHKTLLELKEKQTVLSNDIDNKTSLINDLKEKIVSINSEINTLNNDLEKKLKNLEDLTNTINETEKGYNKIIDAGETLMAIINQNITSIDYN